MKAVIAAAATLLAFSAYAEPQQRPPGYLAPDAIAADFLNGPPVKDSPAFAADRAAREHALAARDGPRWTVAQADADIDPASAARLFDCPLGASLGQDQPPALTRLFTRVLMDVAAAVDQPKKRFARHRPFQDDGGAICVGGREDLAKNGSYPSGHSAAGFAWALVMAEIAPDRAGALIERGREVGDSRVVCGVHYPSDVEAGRELGAAVVAAEHAVPDFRADLEAARGEVAARRAEGRANPVCTAETAALSGAAY